LEGAQGEAKTSAIRHLFGDELVGQGPKRLWDKDDLMKLRGVWCLEMEEMAHQSHSRIEEIKAFLTARDDRYRSPYGHSVQTFKRQCVFIGTTNDLQYLEDSQNRRYWPVTVQRKLTEALRKELESVRNEIWAEAVQAYRAGEAWWFTDGEDDLLRLTKDEQSARRIEDPWQEYVEAYLRGRMEASTQAILSEVLRIDANAQTSAHTRRLANCLKVAGWKRVQLRKKTGRVWLYVPKDQAIQVSFLDTTETGGDVLIRRPN
ncbi:MAG: VapE domain-containing protein, partial [Candidatus Micrarchaeaceae archaeon]